MEQKEPSQHDDRQKRSLPKSKFRNHPSDKSDYRARAREWTLEGKVFDIDQIMAFGEDDDGNTYLDVLKAIGADGEELPPKMWEDD